MIKRVFVAVDNSPRAAAVIARGVEIARGASASVQVYHAVTIPPDFPPAAATEAGDPLPAHLHRVATTRLEALVAEVRDVPCEILVEESLRTWRTILEAAERYNADLIVIGSHGYDLVDRLLGTTAAKVVNGSSRDVLVVR
jgi:nucleotide-binding universal stress UspA family protein